MRSGGRIVLLFALAWGSWIIRMMQKDRDEVSFIAYSTGVKDLYLGIGLANGFRILY